MEPTEDERLTGPSQGGEERPTLRRYVLLGLMGVIPIVALAVFAYVLASRAIERLVHAGHDATVLMTGAFVEREFRHWEFTLASYTGFPVLQQAVASGDLSEVRRRLELIVSEQPRMDRAFVTDTTGLLWVDFPEAPESQGERFDDRDWYRGVKRGTGPYISELYQRHASPSVFVVAIAVPVLDPATGETAGFLVGQVLPSGISDLVREVGAGGAGTVILLDHRGTVVAHPTLDLRSRPHREYADLLPSLASSARQISRGEYVDPLTGTSMLASFMGAEVGDHQWTVVAKQPVAAAFAPTRTLAVQLAGAGLLLALLVGGLALGLVRENTRRGRAERELAAMNQELERRVEERTTELRETEEELRHAQKLEAVGRLAGGIAHDFNNLLTVILGSSQYLLDSLPADSPMRRDVEDLNAAGESASELTRQLLAFSRKQVLNPRVLDVNQAVGRMRGILERVIGEDVDLAFRLAPELHPVKFDPGKIEQVIMNLAVNARDAMPGGGKLTIKTANVELDDEYAREHPAAQIGPHVMLAVSDTGEGMDAETRERIFEPFFTTKGMGRGTGLGLSTVYGIVKQGGGNIWVYSEPGRGATFKIYLPRTEEAPRIQEEDPTVEPGAETGTVMVVEDGEAVRAMVVRALGEAGFTVLEAADAEEALDTFRGHAGPLDLLLTDVILPDMAGPELAVALDGRQDGLRVLYMSGYTDESIVHHGILAEGTSFIEKPFRPRDLLKRVREALAASR